MQVGTGVGVRAGAALRVEVCCSSGRGAKLADVAAVYTHSHGSPCVFFFCAKNRREGSPCDVASRVCYVLFFAESLFTVLTLRFSLCLVGFHSRSRVDPMMFRLDSWCLLLLLVLLL